MTRKDYIKLAEAIKMTLDQYEGTKGHTAEELIGAIAGRIGAVCASENANFDPKRFFTACGLYKGN